MNQPTTAQKILRVIAILSIIGAVITMILAGILLFSGGYYSANGTEIDGMTAVEAGVSVAMVGVITLVEGIISLLEGILGLRAAKDNKKIMPVWILSIIGLAGAVISGLTTVFGGGADASAYGTVVGSLVGSGLMFWLANTIKQEAGK